MGRETVSWATCLTRGPLSDPMPPAPADDESPALHLPRKTLSDFGFRKKPRLEGHVPSTKGPAAAANGPGAAHGQSRIATSAPLVSGCTDDELRSKILALQQELARSQQELARREADEVGVSMQVGEGANDASGRPRRLASWGWTTLNGTACGRTRQTTCRTASCSIKGRTASCSIKALAADSICSTPDH